MNPSVEVAVIGDAMLDVLATPVRPPTVGSDVPASIQVAVGGQGANLAVRLSRQGVGVGLVAPIGTDPAGALVRDALVADGVLHLGPPVAESGVVVVLRDDDGERTMLSRRAPLGASPELLDAERVRWVVVSGYALLDPAADQVVEAIRHVDHRVVVGCALTSSEAVAWHDRVGRIRPAVLVLNRDEQRILGDGPVADVVIVTEPGGAELRGGASPRRVKVPDGPPAIDTTGAGDALAAGLLARLVRSPTWPPDDETLQAALEQGVARVAGAQTRVRGEADGTLSR